MKFFFYLVAQAATTSAFIVQSPSTPNSALLSSESVESGPSANLPSNVLVNFAPLPEGDMLPYDDTKAILADFNVKEYISSESNLLITDQMKTIYQKLERNGPPFTVLLFGASGVGKTMTLLFVGNMARKSGCLVFPIQAKKFVNQDRPLSEIVRSFLSDWIDAVGEEFLKQIPCKWAKFSNLFDLINDGLDDLNKVIRCFQTLVGELKSLKVVPIVFIIDQCNAFYTKHTLKIFPDDERTIVEPGSGRNPIGSLFVQWNTFDLKSGCILYAFSSSFNMMPFADDGNSRLFKTIQPMEKSEFKKLVELAVNDDIRDKLLADKTFDELFYLCSGIPRELLAFTLAWTNSGKPNFDFNIVKVIYLEIRREFYEYRIKRLFNKEKMGKELFRASVSFASRVFVGRPMGNAPPIWRHAGLITLKNGKYELLCPAAADAILTSIDNDVMREAVYILNSDPSMRWRALELGVVYKFRHAILSGDPVALECTNLNGESSSTLYLKVNNIVHFESTPLASSLPRGTMLVCPVRTPVIDFFIHGMDGEKVALQVSESAYIDHKSKYADFDKVKEDYNSAVINGNTSEIQYVYLTTSDHRMIKTGKHYTEQVLLISNINDGATKFFNGLILPVDSKS